MARKSKNNLNILKLSIIVPVYNGELYIAKCLDSLIAQDIEFEDYEIIVINDGSADTSADIIDHYSKIYSHIRLINQKNVGLGASRNIGISLAKGKYIYFIDVDDYLAHNSLGGILKYAIENYLQITGFGSVMVDDIDKCQYEEVNLSVKLPKIMTGNEFFSKESSFRVEAWWYLIERDYLLDLGLRFEEGVYFEDVSFTLRLILSVNRMSYFPDTIHRYVQTKSSIIRNGGKRDEKKMNDNLKMLNSFSVILDSLLPTSQQNHLNTWNNLVHKRDMFVFFSLIKLIRQGFSGSYVKKYVKSLERMGAYPMRQFLRTPYDSPLYIFLNFVLNKPWSIILLVYLRKTCPVRK